MSAYLDKYRTAPVASSKMPGGIPYIVGNEAAERFSFYGMRTILTIFMVKYLHFMGEVAQAPMSEAAATERFHNFVTAVYFFPILGALVSDIFLGKYRTIISLSIVYCAGHACLAFMGWLGSAGGWLVAGLVLISVGSGGIKPCVSAHVGDQFGKTNSRLISRVFNYFYFSINLGAFISTLLTPWLLEWYGPHWAFGVPGILMAIATFVFWLGRHKFVHIPARGIGFLKETLSREGIFALLKLSVIYVFVAAFWALFDQTGSTWVLQARDMNLRWLGITWLPSQIQAINPVMILTFIPLFTFIVYPAIHRFFPLTPLRKISIGLFVTVGSFAIIALTQEWIDAGERPSIAWQVLAYAVITAGEVMVSIVCLEFSYTQAPRTMKSFIMALFLMSVSLGNVFTALVNRFIQIPNTLAIVDAAEKPSDEVRIQTDGATIVKIHRGFDGEFGTADDIRTTYVDGKRQSLNAVLIDDLRAAAEAVETRARAGGGALPTTEEGQGLMPRSDIAYRLLNSRQFRVATPGADNTAMTPWDTGILVEFAVPEEIVESWFERALGYIAPEQRWLEARKKAFGFEEESGPGPSGITVTHTEFVGGLTRLEGAPYFWFFTWVMLGTAVLFVFVALVYTPREYLQKEDDEFEAEAQAEAEGL